MFYDKYKYFISMKYVIGDYRIYKLNNEYYI